MDSLGIRLYKFGKKIVLGLEMIPQCGFRAAAVCRDRRHRRGRIAPCEKMPPRDGQDMAPLRRATIHDRRTFDSYMGPRHRSDTAGLGGLPSAAKRLVERCNLAEPPRATLKMETVGRAERELCLKQPRQILFAEIGRAPV